jgi:hypothetical protein
LNNVWIDWMTEPRTLFVIRPPFLLITVLTVMCRLGTIAFNFPGKISMGFAKRSPERREILTPGVRAWPGERLILTG